MLDHEWAEGLEPLYDGTFPRRCPTCSFPFNTFEAMCDHTSSDDDHGLAEASELGRFPFVEVERRCRCGTRVREHCADRRDKSADARERREAFDHKFLVLCQQGVDRDKARYELRKLARGRSSRYLLDRGFGNFAA